VTKALTAISVENYKPGPVRREIPDPGRKGLYLVVQPTGRKSFAVRFRVNGKPKKLTLERGTTLAAARVAASSALEAAEKDVDPTTAKRAEKRAQQELAANTFQAVAENYLKREGKKLRSVDWQRRLLERLVYAGRA
jgi:hypothetical protein